MWGREIREPADVLGDVGEDTVGVESSVDDRTMTVARSIIGSDILDTFSNTPDSKDMVKITRGSKVTSDIANCPNTNKTIQGQQGVSGSTVICTMASTE